jgi:hypothetical protein
MDDNGNALDNYAAVVDTNLTDMKGAESRIQAARKTGRPVDIIMYTVTLNKLMPMV